MPGRDLRRAIIAAPLTLLLSSTVTFTQDSGSGSTPNPTASPSVAAEQNTEASTQRAPARSQNSKSPGQKEQGLTADEWQSRLRKLDPELAAVVEAENEERWVDAEKLLRSAIQKAEASPESKRRLRMLLDRLARVEFRLGRGDEALADRQRVLDIDRELYGPQSPFVVEDLVGLASSNGALRHDQAAEEYFGKALAITRETPGPKSSALLMVLRALAIYYLQHDRSAEAEPLIEEALRVCQPGPGHSECDSFRRLQAQVYSKQGQPSAAERIGEASVAADASSDANWREKAAHLEQLAAQYEKDEAYNFAEKNYRQALALIEANDEFSLPPVLNSLGELLVKERRNAEAEELFKRALDLQEKAIRGGGPFVGRWLTPFHLESLYRSEGRLADMEPILKHFLAFGEQFESPEGAYVGWILLGFVRVYSEEGKYSDAEAPCDRALKIQEAHYGPDSPQLMSTLWTCSEVARHLGKTDKANALESRMKKLREK